MSHPPVRWGVSGRFGSAIRAGLVVGLAAVFSVAQAEAKPRKAHAARSAPVGLTAPGKDAALIIDGETGKTLYARNAGLTRHPASLTKMMTLYMLFEAMHKGQVSLSTEFPVSAHASAQSPTKLYLKPGDSISVETAIKAIIVRSANDVAVTVAEGLGGSESQFAAMMTAKARALGMSDTVYKNASGLPDNRQITTAYDLATLARHLAYDYPQYFHYFSTPGFTYKGRYVPTHNNLLGNYEGTDGIKTGYTQASGFNLVTSVVRDGAHIIGVVMGGRSSAKRDREMVRLLDNTFGQIAENPRLVARAVLPWKSPSSSNQTGPVLAGFVVPSTVIPTKRPSPTSVAKGPTLRQVPQDEDAAESAGDIDVDEDDDSTSDNVIAAVPAPRPILAAYKPREQNMPIPTSRASALSDSTDVLGGLARSAAKSLGIKDWTIQIGAFTDMGIARAQLASYAEKSMDVLGQAQRIIVPFQAVDGHTLYRARFGPFAEREAREVCTRLTERGQTCFAATVR